MWQEIIVFTLFFGIIGWWIYKTYFKPKKHKGSGSGACDKCNMH